mgnify:FL=1
MEYKKGFNVKPKEINAIGEVTFTDGTYDFPPNELQCEAYGYTYNKSLGTCSAFNYSNKVAALLDNRTNNVKGGVAEVGTVNSIINGEGNTLKGSNRNAFITGQECEIPIGLNNSSILGGKMGKVIRQGEMVLGGGSYNLGAGYTQSSKMQLSGKTTDASAVKLEAQDIDDAFITLQTNSVVGYDIFITRLETGGASGTAGQFSYRSNQGAVRVTNTGSIIIYDYQTKTIAKKGVNASFLVVDSTTGGVPSITIEVSDRAAVNNLWSATIYLHEIRTNIDF